MQKKQVLSFANRFSIAPMLEYTDSYFRQFFRHISAQCMLYTEMIPTGAILFGDVDKALAFNPAESPLTLQLGGNNPDELGQCALIARQRGFQEVNLNAGCPSSRVQAGAFGAMLMQEPDLVARCCEKMAKSGLPVSVKTRLGFVGADAYDHAYHFIKTVSAGGCRHFILHARQAALSKSPKENRTALPLLYQIVYQLKNDFPDLFITLNGNITTLDDAQSHLAYTDGVMIGRWAYHNPYAFIMADDLIFNSPHPHESRGCILAHFLPLLQQDRHYFQIAKCLMGLFHGTPVAKAYRGFLGTKQISELEKLTDYR